MLETPTREVVARAIVRATTPDDLTEARMLREAYLLQNPNDTDIQDMGDLLDTLAAALKPKDSQYPKTGSD